MTSHPTYSTAVPERDAPLFDDPVHVLDPCHVGEQVADTATKLFPRAPGKAKQLVKAARRALGIRDRRGRTHFRKGPRKRRQRNRHVPFRGSGVAHAILQVRMLAISERWAEWWAVPGRAASLAGPGHAA